ncbi:methyltransferase domain-containing protein [Nitrosovibrio sp. Nv6]|uniref:methyltransferase domain-containing protein n=1 Tax=Nitrosovibrio sp. Nv6 TaxID=1855340 RepID=UPI0008C4E154|nr:methyltransferase domain-containing protein [Nitrosovibrio sp. Nv6]SEP23908.1 Methyltransferase domain-containing protein [Nitrosovibrio sp. Nv6]
MNYFLPSTYRIRQNHDHYLDSPNHLTYQPHVYHLACFLAERCGATSIIDIGCGSGEKLKVFGKDYEIICIDYAPALDLARQSIPHAEFIEFDLENGLPIIPSKILERSIVICSDVIEHLRKPDQLMRALARLAELVPYVLISTPDRDRARGWLDNGPPANPAHTMEWNASEFVRFMHDSGFEDIPFYGHTINTDIHELKSTILTIAGTHAISPVSGTQKFRVAAVIHTFNESDILSEVIEYLNLQGVEVHVFDNWSTDGSWELINKLGSLGKVQHAARFPDKRIGEYQWKLQLEKTAEYSEKLNVDWVMHYDADEIRCSPWSGISLKDAIEHVDRLGYSAIDFTVIDFRFLTRQSKVSNNYQNNLNHFEFGRRPGHFKQIKAWKNMAKVDLASSGGHDAVFHGRNIFPLKFLTKHYPLRNALQANRKVFHDRLPRMEAERKAFGWHRQYDGFGENGAVNGWDSHTLVPWHSTYFMSEFLVERISGIGLQN